MLSNLLADVNQFLPTPSHGGRHPLLLPRAPRGIISTHALTWRATSAGEPPNDRPPDFYPRPHMEGDLCTLIYTPPTSQFLPTPSHGGRRSSGRASTGQWNFYPRPHMEGDPEGPPTAHNQHISTHALTWRATKILVGLSLLGLISTHALTWRATLLKPISRGPTLFLPTPSHGGRRGGKSRRRFGGYFYPRPHMEGDRGARGQCIGKAISTHALTWRATVSSAPLRASQTHFYPRPHMEGDAPPRNPAGVSPRYFYPRPHMEGDPAEL